MSISKENAQKWANALRSGKYKQRKYELENDDRSLCCLGVACKIFIPEQKQKTTEGRLCGGVPHSQLHAPKWLKHINDDFSRKIGFRLSELNDHKNYSFNEIADLIELVYVHKAL